LGIIVLEKAAALRQGWLDTYRGIAVLFMVTIHYMWVFAPTTWHQGAWTTMDQWAGTAMTLFIYATGCAAVLNAKKKITKGQSRRRVLLEVLPGSLLLVALVLIFHQMWYGWILPLNPSGILVLMGPSRILVTTLQVLELGPRIKVLLAAALTFSYYALRDSDPMGLSVILVCLGPALVGGYYVEEERTPSPWQGLGAVILGYVLMYDLSIRFIKMPMSLSYLVFSIGVALTIHAASQSISEARFIGWLGKHSLETYLGHHILQVWTLMLLGSAAYEIETLVYATLICVAWYVAYRRIRPPSLPSAVRCLKDS
jgi:uncharacterized membrane protein